MRRPRLLRSVHLFTIALGALLAGMVTSSVLAEPHHAPASMPPAAGDPVIAYVANSGSASVSVVDLSSLSVIATIPVGNGAGTLAVSPDGGTAYVGHRNDNSVGVIDTSSHSLVATVSGGIGSSPDGLVLSPDGSRLYVSNRLSNTISVVDTTSLTVVDTFAAISHPLSGSVTPDGSRLYVPNWGDNSVSSIDTSTGASTRIPVGARPVEAAISPDGSEVWATTVDDNEVAVIDTTTDSVVTTIGLPRPFGAAFSPDGTRAYVPGGSSAPTYIGTLSVIDTATRAILATPVVGALGNYVAADPGGATVLVPNRVSGDVSVIDSATNLEIGRIPVGASPLDVAYITQPAAEKCFKFSDNPEIGTGERDQFVRWAPSGDNEAEGIVSFRRRGDGGMVFMAGDPVPGIDISVEQNPGGSIKQMLIVPSDDGRPTFKGVTQSGAIVTMSYNVPSGASTFSTDASVFATEGLPGSLEIRVTRDGVDVGEPTILIPGGEMSDADKITILQLSINYHAKHGFLSKGIATSMVGYLERAKSPGPLPPDRWLYIVQNILSTLDRTKGDRHEPLPTYQMMVDDIQQIRDGG